VVGWSWSESTRSSVPFVARYTPAGALDRTFGTGGVVRTPGAAGTLSAVAIQGDGKIVVAGGGPSGTGGRGDFVLARYDASGRPDTSFDGDGVAFTDFGLGAVAVGLAIQRDGKIVAVGNAKSAAARDALEFAVARYNADGSLDAGFGGDGRVTTPFTPVVDSAVDAAVQPDGRIVVGGYAGYSFSLPNSPQRPDYALVRYNADGSLDASFDEDGKSTSAGICTGSGPCLTGDLALQTDGKILLAGGQVARFHRDGSLDSAFGREGRAAPDLHARSVLVQPDGRIVAAGGAAAPRGDFAVARLLPSGQRDRSFGTAGRAAADLGGGTSDSASAAALQSDRRIVLAGTVEVRETPSQLFDVGLVRFLNPASPRCVVPNLRGLGLRAARASVARGRCALGRVTRRTSRKVTKGKVIAQSPRPGTSLPAGGRVNIVLGKGPASPARG